MWLNAKLKLPPILEKDGRKCNTPHASVSLGGTSLFDIIVIIKTFTW